MMSAKVRAVRGLPLALAFERGLIDATTAAAAPVSGREVAGLVGEVADFVEDVAGSAEDVDGDVDGAGDVRDDSDDADDDPGVMSDLAKGGVAEGLGSGSAREIGPAGSIPATGATGPLATMSPHISAAPTSPLPRAATASLERPVGSIRTDAVATVTCDAADAGILCGSLTSRDGAVAAVRSRNASISSFNTEAGFAGRSAVAGVVGRGVSTSTGTSGLVAPSGAESAARMAAASSATF